MSVDRIRIQPIQAFSDNYIWLFHDGIHAVVVDPGAASTVINALDKLQLALCAIVVTHLHFDHNGGVPGLLERWSVPVYGPLLNEHDKNSHPPWPKPGTVPLDCVSHVIGEGDTVTMDALEMELSVLAVPGHTLGHLAFLEQSRGWLFTGDTMFGGGCGKVFGGSMQAMIDSLDRLARMPAETEVYCAHEYTLANLAFARTVEPSNVDIASRLENDGSKRDRGIPTLPSTIGLERATNPFLRVLEPEILRTVWVQRGVEASTRKASFEVLRTWKNEFKA